jgi:hypothetical protein
MKSLVTAMKQIKSTNPTGKLSRAEEVGLLSFAVDSKWSTKRSTITAE